MNNIQDKLKLPKVPIKKASEYGELQNYFFELGMENKAGRKLSRGALGFLLSPIYRKGGTGMLFDLKRKCELSKNPAQTFWYHVKLKK